VPITQYKRTSTPRRSKSPKWSSRAESPGQRASRVQDRTRCGPTGGSVFPAVRTGGAISIDSRMNRTARGPRIGVFNGPVAFSGRYRSTRRRRSSSPWTQLTTGIDTALTGSPRHGERPGGVRSTIYNSAEPQADEVHRRRRPLVPLRFIVATNITRPHGSGATMAVRDAANLDERTKRSTFGSRLSGVRPRGRSTIARSACRPTSRSRAVIPHRQSSRTRAFRAIVKRASMRRRRNLWVRSTAGVTWRRTSPGNHGRYVHWPATGAHPTNPDLVYLGTESRLFPRLAIRVGSWHRTVVEPGDARRRHFRFMSDHSPGWTSTALAHDRPASRYVIGRHLRPARCTGARGADVDVSAVPPGAPEPAAHDAGPEAPRTRAAWAPPPRIAFHPAQGGHGVRCASTDVTGRLVGHPWPDGLLLPRRGGLTEHVIQTGRPGIGASIFYSPGRPAGAILSKKTGIVR
jgi:hypothetical protein